MGGRQLAAQRERNRGNENAQFQRDASPTDSEIVRHVLRVASTQNVCNGWKADIDRLRMDRNDAVMFTADPKARADLKSGTLYALVGEGGWVYYGQVTPEKSVGFFRRRDREVSDVSSVLCSPVMAVVSVAYPSITRALRAGQWTKVGRYELVESLRAPRRVVQWPVGTLNVAVWEGADTIHETRVEDPAIQDLELMAVWDAQHHIPARLTADFGAEEPSWHVGGPIRRERRVKEETAKRFPDQPWNQLPTDWTPTTV